MKRKHSVLLSEEQRLQLKKLVNSGHDSARKLVRARVLLLADISLGEGLMDEEIIEAIGVCRAHVCNVRRTFAEDGLEAALLRKPQPERPDKRCLSGEAEAYLIALACSPAPPGRAHWTMQLLADKMVSLSHCEAVSDETVRKTLKKTNSSRGRTRSGAYHRNRTLRSCAAWRTS